MIVEDKVEARFGRIRMCVIKNAEDQTLLKAIQSMVSVGSIIRNDQHKSYSLIKEHYYEHKPVAKVVHKLGEDNTPLVQKVASLFKRWLLGTHQGGMEPLYIPSYLYEYTFRFNRLKSKSRDKLLFDRKSN